MTTPTPAPISPHIPQGSDVPSCVLEYAPLIWMDESETYFPSDLTAQITNTTPQVNFKPVSGYPEPLTLANLDSLNAHGGTNVCLTSKDDITKNPAWLYGVKPDGNHSTPGATACVIVTVDQGATLDAFYFFFYAYNQGNRVIGMEFGDHVGDWEHMMIRFDTATKKPVAVWYSQHSSGQAFTYDAVEKYPDGKTGSRPVGYCARGSHANYATPGTHDHALPDYHLREGLVEDHTSSGTLWDPTRNAYIYRYDPTGKTFTAYNGVDPAAWLSFQGHWGDDEYPEGKHGQVELFGNKSLAKYVAGPDGPQNKNLVRKNVWPDSDKMGFLRDELAI